MADTFTARATYQLSNDFRSSDIRQDAVISFHRSLKTINWMIAHPWVVSRSEAREDVEHYHFSRVRDLIRVIALEIFAPGGQFPKGYVVVSISRKESRSVVKILDFRFEAPEDTSIAGYLGLKCAADHRVDRLEYPTALESFFAVQSALNHGVKRRKRLYLFHPRNNDSPLAKLAPGIKLNYCDSDTAFT